MPKMCVGLIAVYLLVTFVGALVMQRPCLNVVKYVEQHDTRLIAEIALRDPAGLQGVWLNITFDQEAQVLANQFGPATTLDNHNFLIKRLDYTLLPGETQVIRILVKHNDVKKPSIIKVLLNGRSICPGSFALQDQQCPVCKEAAPCPEGNYTVSDQLNLTENQAFNVGRAGEGITDAAGKPPPVPIVDVKAVCGTVKITKDKISRGSLAEEGNYPWQLALMHSISAHALQYVCSGGLISQRFALTAAHCVTKKDDGSVNDKDNYTIYAGTTKLSPRTEHEQVYQLSSIHVHEKYNTITLEDDIAVLGLQTLAKITDYVRPLCLPTHKMTRTDLYDRRGVVAGWGYTEDGLVNNLRFTGMPIVSVDSCIFSDRMFYSLFISPKVFCAGARNGTTVCQGDSGAPLAVEGTEVGDEDRFYIRGIVSLSKETFGLKCSAWDYAIFTDVRSYMPWIKEIVDI